MADNNIDYEDLKKRGFLKQRQDGFFILRTRMSSGVYKNTHLEKLGEIARKYANGIVHATTRQGLEIPFIKPGDIPAIEKELSGAGVSMGTSGARLRATTVCPGNNWCRFGLIDTFSLSAKIEELGMRCGLDLPHKFKIAISGCPNGCTRPQYTEIGIHGQIAADKDAGYAIYVGGCGGRAPIAGIKIEKTLTEKEALSLIKRIAEFYKDNAKPRQRLATLIDQIGKDDFLKKIGVK